MAEHLLIEIVQSNPILYDRKRPDCKDINKKMNVWNSVSNAMNLSVDECQRMWRNLRERYAKERRLFADSTDSAPSWEYYKNMSFMERHILRRKRTSNITLEKRCSILERFSPPLEDNSTQINQWDSNHIIASSKYEFDATETKLEALEVLTEDQQLIEEPSIPIPTTINVRNRNNTKTDEALQDNAGHSKSNTSETAEAAFGRFVSISLQGMSMNERRYKISAITNILMEPYPQM